MLELNHLPHGFWLTLSAVTLFSLIALVPSAFHALPKSFPKIASIIVIFISCLVLIGWLLHIAAFKNVSFGLLTMKFNSALIFILASASLILFEAQRNPKTRFVARSLAFIVTIFSLATLSQYLFGWELGIDQLFVHESTNNSLYPGRMASSTAMKFSLLGLALCFIDQRRNWIVHLLAIAALLLSLISFIGYLYQVQPLYTITNYSIVGLYTTICFIILSVGILFTHPDFGLMKIVLSNSPGGVMARRLLPAAIFLIITIGLLRLMGERAGLYNMEIGLSLMVLASIITLSSIILWNAQMLYRMDIERKQTEEALLATEERYRDLFENANDIIYLHDLQGNFTSINRMTTQLTGYTSDEASHLNITQIIAPEYVEFVKKNLTEKLSEKAEATIYKLEILCKDGHILPVEVSSRLVYKEGKPVAIQGIARDISERHELEDQLRQAQKMESIGRLAGSVAHDFNNLLTAIIGYSQLAMRHLEPDAPVQKEIREVEKAGKRAAELTNQLLTFSRKQALQPKTLDINQVVINVENLLGRLIGEDIELATKLSSNLNKVKADPGQLEQIIMNLAVNARDAMPQVGKLTIETANVELNEAYAQTHLAVQPGYYVMLAVSDTGTGMDKETQSRIFEPFFTTKDLGKGTGLGLSTVYGIVKQSGGTIWVYSEPDKGTTFKIYFPVIEEDARFEEARLPISQSLTGTETILLVEDDEAVRKIVCRILETSGYTVLQATSTDDALGIYRRYMDKIDLLITDVVMPVMSGRELVQQISGFGRKVKVLYMSGYTDNAIVHHGVLEANKPFLQKPFSPEALTRKVRAVINGL
jgi:two-component system cell cycle sensor histidine kinase/response regulator CckA